jgi:hypothetical protein
MRAAQENGSLNDKRGVGGPARVESNRADERGFGGRRGDLTQQSPSNHSQAAASQPVQPIVLAALPER